MSPYQNFMHKKSCKSGDVNEDSVDDTADGLGLCPADCMLIVYEFKHEWPFCCCLQASKLSSFVLEPVNQRYSVGTDPAGIKSPCLVSFKI